MEKYVLILLPDPVWILKFNMKQTKAITLSALITALSVGILFMGGIVGIGTYAAPLLAGLCLIPVGMKAGKKYHILSWLCVSLLSFILVRDVEETLMFFCLFGWYPAARDAYHRLSKALSLTARALTALLITMGVEALVMMVLVPETESFWIMAIFLFALTAVFLMYDLLIPKVERMVQKYGK